MISYKEIERRWEIKLSSRWPRIKRKRWKDKIWHDTTSKTNITETNDNSGMQADAIPCKRRADYLFYNSVPLPNTNFYPFSKRPVTGDIFYIGDEEAFSKKCRQINIVISYAADGEHIASTIPDDTLTNSTKTTETTTPNNTIHDSTNSNETPIVQTNRLIVWEYSDGKKWKKIPDLKITSINGKNEDEVTFICPCDIEKTAVNNHENYWVRARIAFGDYGSEKYKVKQSQTGTNPTTFEYEILYDKISAPNVQYINVTFVGGVFTEIKHYVAYNNLAYKKIAKDGRIMSFKPFELLDEPKSSFYLGFDKKIQSGPISVYFDIDPDYNIYEEKPTISFYYYNGQWEKINADDNTDGFTRSGEVKLLLPFDFIASNRFGHELYWIKISHSNQTLIRRKIKGIFLNTVIASNSEAIRDESLGSSNNLPDQIFELKKTPLYKFPLKVWVRAPHLLSSKKREELLKRNELFEVVDGNRNILEQWVLWQETDNIENSKPDDQHFEADQVLKKIQFGNGLHGKIPSAGFDSIKIDYVAGGGKEGNLGKNAITSLISTVPFVSSVNNPLPAEGGIDQETIPHLLLRAPHSIKNRGQAITCDDYEWLIQEHFPSVSKSKCLAATRMDGAKIGGHVTVVMVPFSEEKKPMPNRGLIDQVEKMLKNRSAVTIKNGNLRVIPPKYIVVSVTGTVYCKTADDVPIVEKKALDVLERFFHPLRGGREQKGWDFGELICLSDVYVLLEEISEAENIENLSIVGQFDDEESKIAFMIDDNKKEISPFPPHALICNGSHRLEIKARRP